MVRSTDDFPSVAKIAAESVAVSLIIFICYIILLWDISIFTVFQARDIHRAMDMASGKLIFYGPEVSGGGYSPGSFYYLLLSIPLLLGFSWQSIWYLMMGLAAVGGGLLWGFHRFYWGIFSAILSVLFYASSVSLILELRQFWNPSFLPFFLIILISCLCLAFSTNNKKEKYWVWFCFILGLAIQIHMSAVSLLLAAVLIQIIAPKFKLPRISFRPWWLGSAVFLMTLLPYLIWVLYSAEDSLNLKEGSSYSIPVLLDVIKFEDMQSLTAAIFRKIALIPVLTLVLGVLLPSLFDLWSKYKQKRNSNYLGIEVERSQNQQIFLESQKVLATCLFVSLFPAVYVYISPTSAAGYARYSMVFMVVLVFFASTYYMRFIHLSARFKNYFQKIENNLKITYAIVVLLLVFTIFFNVDINKNLLGKSLSFKKLEFIAESVFDQTGWSYAEAKRRLFYVGSSYRSTPEFFFWGTNKYKIERNADIDGYFVLTYPIENKKDNDSVKSWLKKQSIEATLIEGLDSGDLVTLDPITTPNLPTLVLLPYKVLNRQKLPPHFHNRGVSYDRDQSEKLLLEHKINYPGVVRLKDNLLLFQWNEFSINCDTCTFGALVQFGKSDQKTLNVSLKFIGQPLANSSPWTSLTSTQSLQNPYIKIQCGLKNYTQKLAQYLGFVKDDEDHDSGQRQGQYGHKSFIAPYIRELKFFCDQPLSSIEIGWESSYGYNHIMQNKNTALPLIYKIY